MPCEQQQHLRIPLSLSLLFFLHQFLSRCIPPYLLSLSSCISFSFPMSSSISRSLSLLSFSFPLSRLFSLPVLLYPNFYFFILFFFFLSPLSLSHFFPPLGFPPSSSRSLSLYSPIVLSFLLLSSFLQFLPSLLFLFLSFLLLLLLFSLSSLCLYVILSISLFLFHFSFSCVFFSLFRSALSSLQTSIFSSHLWINLSIKRKKRKTDTAANPTQHTTHTHTSSL